MADDWWDRLYADADADTDAPGPRRIRVHKQRSRSRHQGSAAAPEHTRVHVDIVQPQPRETIRGAAASLLPDDPKRAARVRLLAYNGSAAAAGWWLGIEHFCAQGIAESGRGDVGEGVWVGIGLIIAALVLELRSHGMRAPGRAPLIRFLGWLLRIPLASAVLALALYGPNAAL